MYTVTTLDKIKIWDDNSRDSTKYKFVFKTDQSGKLLSIIIEIEELLQSEPVYPMSPIADQIFIDQHIENFEEVILDKRETAGHLYLLIEDYLQSKKRTFNEQRIRPNKKCQIKILEDGSIKLLDMRNRDVSLIDILEERSWQN